MADNVLFEEDVLGNELEHSEEHNHDEEHSHAHEILIDEHIWLSVENAKQIIPLLTNELIKLDPDNESDYAENSEEYLNNLDVLSSSYESSLGNISNNTIIIADRFPFRYLVEDYDLNYYAAFSGCSSSNQISFDTVKFLIDKVNDLGLDYIFTIEDSNQDISSTIIQDNDIEVLELNSMQSITAEDIANGISYIEVMNDNLQTLTKALN